MREIFNRRRKQNLSLSRQCEGSSNVRVEQSGENRSDFATFNIRVWIKCAHGVGAGQNTRAIPGKYSFILRRFHLSFFRTHIHYKYITGATV